MGIKGRKKRERQRQLLLSDPATSPALGDDGDPARGMKNSDLFNVRDLEYLDALRDRKQRRQQPGKAPVRATPPREPRPSSSLVASPDELWENAGEKQRLTSRATASLATSSDAPPFSHPTVGLDEELCDALAAEGFCLMTPIQQRAIPLALANRDILGRAMTGSGKTLAFVVPILQSTHGIVRANGPGRFVSLIVSPTKELCAQIHTVVSRVSSHLRATAADSAHRLGSSVYKCELVTGGTNIAEERRRLLASSVVVGTPGRVRDHVQNTPSWTVRSTLQVFVLDEADRMLTEGFRVDLDIIVGALPALRQTLMFSATVNRAVGELARLSLQRGPLVVDTNSAAPTAIADLLNAVTGDDDDGGKRGRVGSKRRRASALASASAKPPIEEVLEYPSYALPGAAEEAGQDGAAGTESIPSRLKQFAQFVDVQDRLRALYQFVKTVVRTGAKAMVFCSTIASCQFHCMALGAVGFHDDVLMLHGKMKHRQRLATFKCFLEWPSGVLFCTDVAARGLDIPMLEYILQYDAPLDPTEYVHRIGRTARAGQTGTALIFLAPNEAPFLDYLATYGIKLHVVSPSPSLPDIQAKLEHVLQIDDVVAKAAVAACRAFVSAYAGHTLKATFNVAGLDLDKVAMSFALTSVPGGVLEAQMQQTASHSSRDGDKSASAARQAKRLGVGGSVEGRLKSLNRRRKEQLLHYHREKTRTQWSDEGAFIGVRKPIDAIGA